MKLSEGDFRAHVETMIEERNFAQLEMWIDHGLSIYTNKEQLNTVWEQDYEDRVSEMRPWIVKHKLKRPQVGLFWFILGTKVP